jgi:pyruvate dehydrogenase phosphatase
MAFKLPGEWMTRVFLNAEPPYKTSASKVQEWTPRILTPPYLTARPDVHHRALGAGAGERVLVLASDGLTDVLSPSKPVLLPETVAQFAAAFAAGKADGAPLAPQMLRAAMGGDDMAKASRFLTVEMEGGCMDDTTVVCVRL